MQLAEPAVDTIRHEMRTRRLRLDSIAPRGNDLVTCWFTGDLDGFVSLGSGDHVKFQVPDVDGRLPDAVITDGRLANRAEFALRDMTPREVVDGRLRIDIVRHDGGVVGEWLTRATPGDEVLILGPRGSRRITEPLESARYFVDAAAIPAAERRLAEIAVADAELHVIVAPGAEAGNLDAGDARVIRHELAGGIPGWSGIDAILAESVPADGATLVWAAGEATGVAAARRAAKSLARPGLFGLFNGYWRAGESGYDHHAPLPEA